MCGRCGQYKKGVDEHSLLGEELLWLLGVLEHPVAILR